MKIRVATLIWGGGYGGAERSVRDLAVALNRDQFDMRFFFLAESQGFFLDEISALGYTVEHLRWRSGHDVLGRWRLLKALRCFNPMVVHDHYIPPFTRPLVKLACRCPIVNTEHGRAMRHATGQIGWRRLAAFDLRFCDRVLANSYASKKAVRQVYGFPESKIQVVYLGIDLERFVPTDNLTVSKPRHRIGFVGRILNEQKGTDYLPPVARALFDRGYKNIEFVIVGDGPDRPVVEALCEQLNVLHLFTFLGWRSDVQSLISTFDILLLPSRLEAFGLSALEALVMGVKVVGFDVGGLNEAVGGCDTAFLVPSGDVDAMTREIAHILNSPQTRSQKSRAYVEAHFSSQRMASDLQQVYKEYAL